MNASVPTITFGISAITLRYIGYYYRCNGYYFGYCTSYYISIAAITMSILLSRANLK